MLCPNRRLHHDNQSAGERRMLSLATGKMSHRVLLPSSVNPSAIALCPHSAESSHRLQLSMPRHLQPSTPFGLLRRVCVKLDSLSERIRPGETQLLTRSRCRHHYRTWSSASGPVRRIPIWATRAYSPEMISCVIAAELWDRLMVELEKHRAGDT